MFTGNFNMFLQHTKLQGPYITEELHSINQQESIWSHALIKIKVIREAQLYTEHGQIVWWTFTGSHESFFGSFYNNAIQGCEPVNSVIAEQMRSMLPSLADTNKLLWTKAYHWKKPVSQPIPFPYLITWANFFSICEGAG